MRMSLFVKSLPFCSPCAGCGSPPGQWADVDWSLWCSVSPGSLPNFPGNVEKTQSLRCGNRLNLKSNFGSWECLDATTNHNRRHLKRKRIMISLIVYITKRQVSSSFLLVNGITVKNKTMQTFAKRKWKVNCNLWLIHWLSIQRTFIRDVSFLHTHQYTAAPAEKADFNVRYILIDCFSASSSPHSSSGKYVWLPDINISTTSAHFSERACEVRYASLCSQCQLSFVPLSTQCKDQCRTIPQCCIDKGRWKPNAAKRT